MFLLDSSAWIEAFIRSEKGKKVKQLLTTEKCFTATVSIAEISNWAARQNMDSKKFLEYVMRITPLLTLTVDLAFFAGQINFQRKRIEKNWGMIDSIILATAQNYNMKILTKDSHFRDLPNAEML